MSDLKVGDKVHCCWRTTPTSDENYGLGIITSILPRADFAYTVEAVPPSPFRMNFARKELELVRNGIQLLMDML